MTESTSFDRAADYYDETRGFPPGIAPKVADLLVSMGNLDAASRVLEVGIGTGRIALPLAPHVASITGVDLSRQMMDQLRKKHSDQAIYLTRADATTLPFRDHSFDAAIAVHIFHLIPNWQAAVAELVRTLRPEGYLLAGWGSLGQMWLRQEIRTRLPHKQRWYRGALREEIIEHLESAGWQPTASAVLPFTVRQRPRDYIERMQKRVWSNSWGCTDSEAEAEVELVTEIMKERYDDLDQPIDYESDFSVWAFQSPA